MHCRHCGLQVPDGIRFCPVCGNELRDSLLKSKKTRNVFMYLKRRFFRKSSEHNKKKPAKRK